MEFQSYLEKNVSIFVEIFPLICKFAYDLKLFADIL